MFIPIEFSAEDLERLNLYMDAEETWSEAVHGIVLMVLADLDAQRGMDEEYAS